jgi:hypothetical protein
MLVSVLPVVQITGSRVIDVRPGPVFDTIDQKAEGDEEGIITRNFDAYYPPGGKRCVTYFYAETPDGRVQVPDPLGFTRLVEAEVSRDVLSLGVCRQLGLDNFSLSELMNRIGHPQEMALADLAHILAHMVMPYAQRYAIPFVKELPEGTVFLELAYQNKHNGNEAIIVFNFASDPILVGNILRLAVSHLRRWIAGEETHDFRESMSVLTESNDELFVV